MSGIGHGMPISTTILPRKIEAFRGQPAGEERRQREADLDEQHLDVQPARQEQLADQHERVVRQADVVAGPGVDTDVDRRRADLLRAVLEHACRG